MPRRTGEGTFAQALAANADAARVLAASELATLDSPEAYLGAAEEFRKTLLGDDDGQTPSEAPS